MRVLIVDDYRETADTLSVCMRMLGHDSRTALDARSALDIAATFRPEVGLVDLRLPTDDGLRLSRNMRARFPAMFLALMTGHSRPDLPRRAREAGCDRFLIKPLGLQIVRGLLHEAAQVVDRPGAALS